MIQIRLTNFYDKILKSWVSKDRLTDQVQRANHQVAAEEAIHLLLNLPRRHQNGNAIGKNSAWLPTVRQTRWYGSHDRVWCNMKNQKHL